MLRNLSYGNCAIPQATEKPSSTYERNEKEDMKLAMEYLYDFNEKLGKLHPMCRELMHHIMQERRY